MTWKTITIPVSTLLAELARIRRMGGTITRCCPLGDRCQVTYFSAG
ncbi:hypothetical protein [Nocardioides sp. NPDC004968]